LASSSNWQFVYDDNWLGDSTMLLKMYALSGAAIILWIVPLYSLDKKVSWHRFIQGGSLVAAFSCACSASFLAKRLVEEMAFENAKKAMVIGDMQDELAQSAWLSEQERRLQNEQYLQSLVTPSDGVITPSHTTHLTPLMDKDHTMSHQLSPQQSHPIPDGWKFPDPKAPTDGAVRSVIVDCIRSGWSQTKTIESVFGASKGGNNSNYDAAKSLYQEIKAELGGDGD
jgi:hypothetical protein